MTNIVINGETKKFSIETKVGKLTKEEFEFVEELIEELENRGYEEI